MIFKIIRSIFAVDKVVNYHSPDIWVYEVHTLGDNGHTQRNYVQLSVALEIFPQPSYLKHKYPPLHGFKIFLYTRQDRNIQFFPAGLSCTIQLIIAEIKYISRGFGKIAAEFCRSFKRLTWRFDG